MGWVEFYKAAERVYDDIFPWWKAMSRAEFLSTPPLETAGPDGNRADWRALVKGESWKRAMKEWKELTGLPSLHRQDGFGWQVAATAAGIRDFDLQVPDWRVIDKVRAWAIVKAAERGPIVVTEVYLTYEDIAERAGVTKRMVQDRKKRLGKPDRGAKTKRPQWVSTNAKLLKFLENPYPQE